MERLAKNLSGINMELVLRIGLIGNGILSFTLSYPGFLDQEMEAHL